MKFSLITTVSNVVALATVTVAIENAAVYRFNHDNDNYYDDHNKHEMSCMSQNDATLNLAYNFGISRYYNVEDVENLENIMLSNDQNIEQESKKLILIINGVEQPTTFFQDFDLNPSFNIEIKDDRQSSQFKSFLKDVPNKLFSLKKSFGFKLNKLSNEITLLTNSSKKSLYLKKLWEKHFHEEETSKVEKFWNNLKNSVNIEEKESVLRINKRSINHINDESFINELTQLEFFLNDELTNNLENDNIIINLDSLISIFKKTGITQTYETCSKIISKVLIEKVNKFSNIDTTIILLPIDQSLITLKSNEKFIKRQLISKRSNELTLKRSSSNDVCYSNQLSCLESTDSCSDHGICSKIGSCWKCVCSATKDNNDRTSYWTGNSCEKQDYSTQFNLLFWTTIVLIFSIVSGVKLMYKCGEQELPGVLLAATVQTKKNI
jgi:hypothetical protein